MVLHSVPPKKYKFLLHPNSNSNNYTNCISKYFYSKQFSLALKKVNKTNDQSFYYLSDTQKYSTTYLLQGLDSAGLCFTVPSTEQVCGNIQYVSNLLTIT